MKLYVGIDLHSNNHYVVIIDSEGHTVYEKRLRNEANVLLEQLQSYQSDIA